MRSLILALAAVAQLHADAWAQSDDNCGLALAETEGRASGQLIACAERGDPLAQAWLGMIYWGASDSEPSDWPTYNLPGKWARERLQTEGGRLIAMASVAGVAIAQNELGRAYMRGEFGLTADYQLGVRWLRAASDQQDEFAQYNLAEAYLVGRGVERSASEAERLLRLSATRNYRPARCSLAEILQDRGALDESRAIRNAIAAEAEACSPDDLLEALQ
jgi:TPR repeat protein